MVTGSTRSEPALVLLAVDLLAACLSLIGRRGVPAFLSASTFSAELTLMLALSQRLWAESRVKVAHAAWTV